MKYKYQYWKEKHALVVQNVKYCITAKSGTVTKVKHVLIQNTFAIPRVS